MLLLILVAFFATLQAIVAGYYLVQGVADADARKGSFIFAGIAATTALLLFILSVTLHEPA